MEICGPEGRQCIQKNSANTFNCSTTCQGIYADVQWDKPIIEEEVMENLVSNSPERESNERVDIELEKRLAFIENQIRLLMKNGGTREEFDKEEYRMLTAEYRRFKENNVKHLKFNSESASTSFGQEQIPKLFCLCLQCIVCINDEQVRSCNLQPCSWCRSTSTRPPLTTLRETRRSRRRPS